MQPTSVSLLYRLQRQPLHDDWSRFIALYQPFIERCIRFDPALAADVDDVCQEVMTKLVENLPHFERRRDGSFRSWLKTITAREVAQFWRKRSRSKNLGDGPGTLFDDMHDPRNELSRWWDREHRAHVLRRLQELIEPEFSPIDWRAFRLRVFEQRTTEETSAILGISANSVNIAKSRILARLREEAAGLIEE